MSYVVHKSSLSNWVIRWRNLGLTCLVISFAQQSVGTNLIAGFDHQAISEIYCGCLFLHKLLRK